MEEVTLKLTKKEIDFLKNALKTYSVIQKVLSQNTDESGEACNYICSALFAEKIVTKLV